MAVQIARHLFDVTEYHRLGDAGIFSEDDRVELINGEVVEMSPIGSPHAATVSRLEALLHETIGRVVQIRIQNPVLLDDYSEPEPDIALVRPRGDYYAIGHPRPGDVLLVMEVADSSVEYDRLVKMPLYARAGVPEAWLIDLNRDLIVIQHDPANGDYRSHREFRRGETIRSDSVTNLALSVDDILG